MVVGKLGYIVNFCCHPNCTELFNLNFLLTHFQRMFCMLKLDDNTNDITLSTRHIILKYKYFHCQIYN